MVRMEIIQKGQFSISVTINCRWLMGRYVPQKYWHIIRVVTSKTPPALDRSYCENWIYRLKLLSFLPLFLPYWRWEKGCSVLLSLPCMRLLRMSDSRFSGACYLRNTACRREGRRHCVCKLQRTSCMLLWKMRQHSRHCRENDPLVIHCPWVAKNHHFGKPLTSRWGVHFQNVRFWKCQFWRVVWKMLFLLLASKRRKYAPSVRLDQKMVVDWNQRDSMRLFFCHIWEK